MKILDVKNKIREAKNFEVDSQKLVFKGKNTVNTETLEALGVKEGDFMVVMVSVKVHPLILCRNQNHPRMHPNPLRFPRSMLQSQESVFPFLLSLPDSLPRQFPPALPPAPKAILWLVSNTKPPSKT